MSSLVAVTKWIFYLYQDNRPHDLILFESITCALSAGLCAGTSRYIRPGHKRRQLIAVHLHHSFMWLVDMYNKSIILKRYPGVYKYTAVANKLSAFGVSSTRARRAIFTKRLSSRSRNIRRRMAPEPHSRILAFLFLLLFHFSFFNLYMSCISLSLSLCLFLVSLSALSLVFSRPSIRYSCFVFYLRN